MINNISYIVLTNNTTKPIDLPAYIAIQAFMWVAVLLTIILLLPAVIDIYKTNNTISISKWMYVLYPFCDLAWIVYAVLLIFDKTVPTEEIVGIGICESLNLIFTTYILVKKLKNTHAAKNLHMSEAEWYRGWIKEKNMKDKLKKIGILDKSDLNENKNQRKKLISILMGLKYKYSEIVDKRVVASKIYQKNLQSEIKSPNKRLEHFFNVATNAHISQIISLIYFDIYHLTSKK